MSESLDPNGTPSRIPNSPEEPSQLNGRMRREFARFRSNPMVRNAQWVLLGQGLGYASQAGTFILLARLLGSVEFGIYAGAFSFVCLVAPYSNLGSPAVFLRYVCPDHSRFRLYWGNILLATFSLSTLFNRYCRGTRRRVVHDHRQLRRFPSSDEEHPGEGEDRNGCGFKGGAGGGACEVQDRDKVSTGEDGSHSECSSGQACRAGEARTAEVGQPLRYAAGTRYHSHRRASRTGR